MDLLTKQVQGALLALHYDLGSARDDGIWGPKTRQAMQAYELKMHMPVTDTLTDSVLSNLLGNSVPAPIQWLEEATHLLGLKEGVGSKDNSIILDWADDLDIHYPHDDIAWCGLFVAHCVRSALPNEPLPGNPLGARQYEKFGVRVSPQLGAVATFWRGSPKTGLGHTGFLVGDRGDAYRVRGGNTHDDVSDAWISKQRFVGSFWPLTGPKPFNRPLPVGGSGALSTNEA